MFGYACALFAVLGCVRVVTFGYGRSARSSKKFCVNAGKWLTLCKQYNYMERVRLTKEEKRVLRWLQRNNGGKLKQIEKLAFAPAVRSLEQKGLVRGFCSEEVGFVDAALTESGETYIFFNPRLQNPINRNKVTAIAACISALAAVLGLLVACSVIFK